MVPLVYCLCQVGPYYENWFDFAPRFSIACQLRAISNASLDKKTETSHARCTCKHSVFWGQKSSQLQEDGPNCDNLTRHRREK